MGIYNEHSMKQKSYGFLGKENRKYYKVFKETPSMKERKGDYNDLFSNND